MRSPLQRVAVEEITDAIAAGWNLRFDEFRYLPEGGGAYHWICRAGDARWFVTCDDLDTKPWLGTDRDTVFDGLLAAYGAAIELRASGLGFVVAPSPSSSGTAAHRIDDRHSVSVLPFVDGAPGRWGEGLAPDDRSQLVALLGRMHACDAATGALATRDIAVPGREGLEAALDDLDATWEGGPFAQHARSLLVANAAGIADMLAELDRLAARVHELEPRTVVTHGEPHPGNLIRSATGLALVDWDTVALARPERDLWMLADVDPALLEQYRHRAGITPAPDALRAFRLVWALSDLAAFTAQLRAEHGTEADAERALASLHSILTGTEPRPFGPPH